MAEGRQVTELRRLGKRIVFGLAGKLFLVLHLMIAGRLRWKKLGTRAPAKRGHATFDFPDGTLLLTEASTKKRATLHLVEGEAALAEHDPGGLELADATVESFGTVLTSENHTLKRALTDPQLLSGIGNAYSDEILHRARMSPVKLTSSLSQADIATLFEATQSNGQDGPDEWTLSDQGIDDIHTSTIFSAGQAISSTIIPEPATGALLGAGLLSLALNARRKA